MNEQQTRAEHFRQLHRGPATLVLLNAWDAGSARAFELAGAAAIATTSGGLAAAHGYPDGEQLPLARLAEAVAEITRVVSVPVSVDLEMGYGEQPAQVAQAVGLMLEAGAVGVNLEDGPYPPALLAAKIAAVRELGARRAIPLFINARTDTYLRLLGDPAGRTAETLARLHQYAAAGADGGFVIGLAQADTIAEIARQSPLPLNIMVRPGTPEIAQLRAMGVARVSIGGGASNAILSLAQRIAAELLGPGTYHALLDDTTLTYAQINQMMRKAGA